MLLLIHTHTTLKKHNDINVFVICVTCHTYCTTVVIITINCQMNCLYLKCNLSNDESDCRIGNVDDNGFGSDITLCVYIFLIKKLLVALARWYILLLGFYKR